MAYKPRHLGRTLKSMGLGGTVIRVEHRDLTAEELDAIAKREAEQAARLERIAARARGEEV